MTGTPLPRWGPSNNRPGCLPETDPFLDPGLTPFPSSQLLVNLRLLTTPKGTRTPVLAVRGLRPRPLDDGGKYLSLLGLRQSAAIPSTPLYTYSYTPTRRPLVGCLTHAPAANTATPVSRSCCHIQHSFYTRRRIWQAREAPSRLSAVPPCRRRLGDEGPRQAALLSAPGPTPRARPSPYQPTARILLRRSANASSGTHLQAF